MSLSAAERPPDLLPVLIKCNDSYRGCIADLEESKKLQATPRWYQNELVIVALSIVGFSAGYAVGIKDK